MPSKVAGPLLRLALPLFSILLFFGTGEAALRLLYRGGGRFTLGAPGGGLFEHLTVHDQQRGRLEWGEKPAGVPRVMILGDSITWGTGVRRWEDTWPERLARRLEAEGRPHQFAVLSLPGREIDAHIQQFASWVGEVQPDVLIYQWYVNDIELIEHRPPTARAWHHLPWHAALTRSSYLYYFVDNRLQMLLAPPERSYVDYILTDFIPGSVEWTEFEREFHELATRAHHVPLRLLLLYPQVPFKGAYPLQPIHDRMKALGSATSISIPPAAWMRQAGTIVSRPDSRWKQAVRLPAGTGAMGVATHPYHARRALAFTVAFAGATLHPGVSVATVSAVDAASRETLAAAPLVPASEGSGLQTVRLQLTWSAEDARDVHIAIGKTTVDTEIASIDLEVDYGFHVLDLTEMMNTFDTHVSIFDAHPNPRAHDTIAARVADELKRFAR